MIACVTEKAAEGAHFALASTNEDEQTLQQQAAGFRTIGKM